MEDANMIRELLADARSAERDGVDGAAELAAQLAAELAAIEAAKPPKRYGCLGEIVDGRYINA